MKKWILILALAIGIAGAFAQEKQTANNKNQIVTWALGQGIYSGRIVQIVRTSKRNLYHIPTNYGNFKLTGVDTFSIESIYDSVVKSFKTSHMTEAIKKRVTPDDIANAELHQDTKIRCNVKHHSAYSTFFLIKESYDDYAFCMRDAGTNRFDPSFVFGEEQTLVTREILWKRFLASILIICFCVFLVSKDVSMSIHIVADIFFVIFVTIIIGFICLLLFYDEHGITLDVPFWQYALVLGPIILISSILIAIKKHRIRNSWKRHSR